MSLSLQQKNDFHFISDIIAQLNVFFWKMCVFSASHRHYLRDFEKEKRKKKYIFLLFCLIGLRKIRALFFFLPFDLLLKGYRLLQWFLRKRREEKSLEAGGMG